MVTGWREKGGASASSLLLKDSDLIIFALGERTRNSATGNPSALRQGNHSRAIRQLRMQQIPCEKKKKKKGEGEGSEVNGKGGHERGPEGLIVS